MRSPFEFAVARTVLIPAASSAAVCLCLVSATLVRCEQFPRKTALHDPSAHSFLSCHISILLPILELLMQT